MNILLVLILFALMIVATEVRIASTISLVAAIEQKEHWPGVVNPKHKETRKKLVDQVKSCYMLIRFIKLCMVILAIVDVFR